MASTNQSPEYKRAQEKFFCSSTNEERLESLEEMIRTAPKHKSSENLLANLKTRYKKLKLKIEKSRKKGKSSKQSIKKQEMQAVIVGKTNTGKSCLLSALTNAKPEISKTELAKFTTKVPMVGMIEYGGAKIQLIENPAIESLHYDKGVANTADTILILVTKLEQIKEVESSIKNCKAKKIIVFNIKENLNKRKLEATLKSRQYNYVIVNLKTSENLEELKEKIFKSFNKIRVYTKEPGKEKTLIPIILDDGSTVKDVAEKIFHGLSSEIKETKITGPSAKFSNQNVSLKHELKDLDVVEFKMK